MTKARIIKQPAHGQPRWLQTAGGMLLLIALYAVLTAAFTNPLYQHAGDYTPVAGQSADQCKTLWFFWWTDTALFKIGQNPLWSDAIYYPHGTSVAYHICLSTSLIAVGVSKLLGVAAASPLVYNVLLFFSFILTGLASFWLIRYVTRNALVAVAASLFVTFAPYRLWHLDHLNLLSMEWGILAIYFAIRYLNEPRYAHLAGAVVFIVLSFYASLTNVMLTVLFLVAYALIFRQWMAKGPKRMETIRGMAIGTAVAFLLVLPGLLSLRSAQSEWNVFWPDMERYSGDAAYMLLPVNHSASGAVGQEYLGWLLLILAAASLWFARRREVRRWAILSAILLVLSLGPTLLIAGHRVLPGWMPQRWLLAIVPYFDLSRSPVRMIAFAVLALAVTASFGLDAWSSRMQDWFGHSMSQAAGVLATVCVAGILLWENGQGSIPLVPMTVPPVYSEVASDPSIKVICDFPVLDKLQLGNWCMYWQTVHGRKSVNGYLAHRSRDARELLDQVAGWSDVGPSEEAILRDAGVDAVVYHSPTGANRLIRLRDRDSSVPNND